MSFFDPVVFQKLCELLPEMDITPERGRPAREYLGKAGGWEMKHAGETCGRAARAPAVSVRHGTTWSSQGISCVNIFKISPLKFYLHSVMT